MAPLRIFLMHIVHTTYYHLSDLHKQVIFCKLQESGKLVAATQREPRIYLNLL
jgi:hypothetical protein